jgi:tRNA(Ile)-lysidine synthase
LRGERYSLLTEMAEEVGARFVPVAHTRDDQVETVLFRLLRGSGLRGLAGMPRTRSLAPSVTLVRPLLAISRADVLSFLTRRNQAWRDDATNADLAYARNRLRHEVLPTLRQLVDVDGALLRAAEQAREVYSLLEPRIEQLYAACDVSTTAAGATLEVAPLGDQPSVLVTETLRSVWRRAGWPEQAMNRAWWTALAELALSPAGGQPLNLPGNVLARRSGEQLVFVRLGERP